jgi:hypothetical protein
MPEPRAELLSAMQHYEDPSGDPNATSSAGAIGPMQVMPSTAKLYGADPATLNDPAVNVPLGSKIMGDLIGRYHGNERAALMAYRQGTKSFDAGKIAPGSQEYADSILSRASVKLPSTDAIDNAYAARKQDEQDTTDGRNAIAADPAAFQNWLKQTGRADATAGMQPPKSPAEAQQQATAVEGQGAGDSMGGGALEDLTHKFVEKPVTELTGSPTAGKVAKYGVQLAPIALGFGKAMAADSATFGGVVPAIKALFGMGGKAGEATEGAEGLAPAIRIKGDGGAQTVFAGKPGETHGDISERIPEKMLDAAGPLGDDQLGFVNKAGKYLTRAEASKAVGAQELHAYPSGITDVANDKPDATNAVKEALPSTEQIKPLAEMEGASPNLKAAVNGLKPAVRDPETGKVYTAPDATAHAQVYDSLPPEVAAKQKLDTGFVGADGDYMTRQQTHDHLIAAQTAGEPAAGAAAPTAEGGGATPAAPVKATVDRQGNLLSPPNLEADRAAWLADGQKGIAPIGYANAPTGKPAIRINLPESDYTPEEASTIQSSVKGAIDDAAQKHPRLVGTLKGGIDVVHNPESDAFAKFDPENNSLELNAELFRPHANIPAAEQQAQIANTIEHEITHVAQKAIYDRGLTGTFNTAQGYPEADAERRGAAAGAAVATPETAAQSLAQRQIANLQATRVGKEIATEFGRPDIATTVPEALTMQESQGLRQNLESYYAQGSTPPKLAANIQALASTYHEENLGIHALNADLRTRAAAGEDVSADGQQLLNRWSALAENYSTLAGTRSDVGRSLQILDPNKPNNAFVAGTAKIAQQFNAEQDGWQKLSDLLHALPPETTARVARQMGEDSSLGRNVYHALHEYYVNNLLSDVGRTGSRIGLSNVISTALTIPRAQIESLIPGSQVKMGEPLARIQGMMNGFWHAVDVFSQAAKTGERVSQIEGGTVSPFVDNNKAISGQAFGLDGTGIGTGIDYLGNVLRLPGRGITAVHQFTHAVASSMELHAGAWRQAVNQAQGEGLSGLEGYQRAQAINKMILSDPPADLRLAAGKGADIATFANAIEKPADDAPPSLANVPYHVQQAFQAPFLRQLMPFFRVAYNVKKMGASLDPTIGTLSQIPGIVSGDPGQRASAVGRAAMTAMFGAAIAHQYHQGNVQLNQYGEPEFVIGDHRVQVPPILDVPYGIIGNYMQNRDAMTDPDAMDKVGAYVKAVGTSFANDSIVQSMVNIKRLMTDVAGGASIKTALKKFIGQEASGLIPWSSLLHAVASGQDVLKRNPQTVGQDMSMSIPGPNGRQSVPPDKDIFDQPVPNPIMGFPKNLLYPVNVTEPTKDPVVNEIARLGIQPVHVPAFLDNYPKAKEQWIKDRADGLHDDLAEYLNSRDYKNDSDLMRKTQMEHILASAARYANTGLSADPKLAAAMEAHRDALKGYSPDMAPGAPQPVTNEFGEAGPAQTSVPAIQ